MFVLLPVITRSWTRSGLPTIIGIVIGRLATQNIWDRINSSVGGGDIIGLQSTGNESVVPSSHVGVGFTWWACRRVAFGALPAQKLAELAPGVFFHQRCMTSLNPRKKLIAVDFSQENHYDDIEEIAIAGCYRLKWNRRYLDHLLLFAGKFCSFCLKPSQRETPWSSSPLSTYFIH